MSFHDPIDSKLLTHYLPFLIRLIVENRLTSDTSSSSILKLLFPQTEFVQYMIHNRLACQLFLRFIMETYHQKHFWLASQLLPYLNELVDYGAGEKVFLHQFVYFVRQSVEPIHYIGILLDKFFVLQAQGHEFVLYYGLVLLKHVLHKSNGTNLVSKYLSISLKPTRDHSTFIHDKYQQLVHDYDECLRQLQAREQIQQQTNTDKQNSFSIFHWSRRKKRENKSLCHVSSLGFFLLLYKAKKHKFIHDFLYLFLFLLFFPRPGLSFSRRRWELTGFSHHKHETALDWQSVGERQWMWNRASREQVSFDSLVFSSRMIDREKHPTAFALPARSLRVQWLIGVTVMSMIHSAKKRKQKLTLSSRRYTFVTFITHIFLLRFSMSTSGQEVSRRKFSTNGRQLPPIPSLQRRTRSNSVSDEIERETR